MKYSFPSPYGVLIFITKANITWSAKQITVSVPLRGSYIYNVKFPVNTKRFTVSVPLRGSYIYNNI